RMGERPGPYHYVILDFAAAPLDPRAPLRPGDDADDAAWVPWAELESRDLVAGLAEFLFRVLAAPGPECPPQWPGVRGVPGNGPGVRGVPGNGPGVRGVPGDDG